MPDFDHLDPARPDPARQFVELTARAGVRLPDQDATGWISPRDDKGKGLSRSEVRALAAKLRMDTELRQKAGQLIVWETNYARPYVYSGMWVADCPAQCGNVELMEDMLPQDRQQPGRRGEKRGMFVCSYCKYMTTSVHWPKDAGEIMEILERRPVPHTRNWYPEGHLTALKYGLKDGETIEELKAENAEHGIDVERPTPPVRPMPPAGGA
jgi:hypothetical protein